MSFAQLNLNPSINKAVKLCGYSEPTPIQASCIPDILLKKDLVASAQTGTGKTAAFILPALHQLSLRPSEKRSRILVLTPTRELAMQISTASRQYGKFLNLNIVSLIGGSSYRDQFKKLSRNVDMIIATPGRLADHIKNHKLDLSAIEMFILDEADRMLDMGFIDEVRAIANKLPKQRQTLLFSATIDARLTKIISNLLRNPTRIDLSSKTLAPSKITQLIYTADNMQHKNRLLKSLLQNENLYKAIIFTATKKHADKLSVEITNLGYEAAPLHGDLNQNKRNRILDRFKNGKIQILVATDVAARGIDVHDISHVINFDLPKFAEDYVHRVGRTGRAGKTGIAISFATHDDTQHLKRIERLINQNLQRKTIEGLEPSLKPVQKKKRSRRGN